MKKKIKITTYHHLHYIAGCNSCDFTSAISGDGRTSPSNVRQEVRKHVLETGHRCWIETSKNYHYSLVIDN